jgi:L-aminopeptidase/D-esterase-like protein
MNCYGFKGGSGTSSRVVPFGDTTFTVGVFLQANFGSREELTITGTPVGQLADVENPMEDNDWLAQDLRAPGGAGSVIVVVATDAPLSSAQCKALARRVPLGLARTGTTGSLFSGDLFLAFSTANSAPSRSGFPIGEPTSDEIYSTQSLPWNRIDAFYAATVYAVEEAVLNALVVNETMIGRDSHRSPALPHDVVRALLG